MLLLAWNNKYSIHILNYLKSLKGAPPAIKDQTGESSKSEAQTWGQLYRRLAKIAPFLWPWKSSWLQFIAVSDVFILLFIQQSFGALTSSHFRSCVSSCLVLGA